MFLAVFVQYSDGIAKYIRERSSFSWQGEGGGRKIGEWEGGRMERGCCCAVVFLLQLFLDAKDS